MKARLIEVENFERGEVKKTLKIGKNRIRTAQEIYGAILDLDPGIAKIIKEKTKKFWEEDLGIIFGEEINSETLHNINSIFGKEYDGVISSGYDFNIKDNQVFTRLIGKIKRKKDGQWGADFRILYRVNIISVGLDGKIRRI